MSLPATDFEYLVVDTDVISFIVKKDPVRAPRYARHLAGRFVILSFSTVAELRYWAEARNWGVHRRMELESYLDGCLIHYPDDPMCTLWASVVASLRRIGRPITAPDAWIAATALHLQTPLLTHNAGHFQDVPDLQLLTEPDV